MTPLEAEKALGSMPMPVTLITSSFEGKDNVMTASWVIPSSKTPPLVSIFLNRTHLTREYISGSSEFVVNVLASNQADISEICGTLSGRKADKYAKAGLKTRAGERVKVPLVEDCLANLECKVVAEYEVGDHTLFVGEIVAAHRGVQNDPLVRFAEKYAEITPKPL
jgi:flavin reductase (DIM6/NTAB) family NADH-FMN oxidoreductase RutF